MKEKFSKRMGRLEVYRDLWGSLFDSGGEWAENDANKRAGTFTSYENWDKLSLMFLFSKDFNYNDRYIFYFLMLNDIINIPTR
ncbi:MAG: hypothetical protein KatS3mg129_2308 [Leptospiraceae bacterium]|nr:MAG: hypothetical protein KatS3mg129_2308 [Leptospiraceae bacterium]